MEAIRLTPHELFRYFGDKSAAGHDQTYSYIDNMTNPYNAPGATLSNPASTDETYTPSMFSVHGRIGRVRYWAYSFFSVFLFGIVVAIAVGVLTRASSGGQVGSIGKIIIGLLYYIPMIFVTIVMAKRRLNDLDHSGWLAIIMLVPIVNFFFALYLLFASGSAGTNQYGPMPSKNTWVHVIAGFMIPIIAVIGILAAIALPAYQQYVQRAKAKAAVSAPVSP